MSMLCQQSELGADPGKLPTSVLPPTPCANRQMRDRLAHPPKRSIRNEEISVMGHLDRECRSVHMRLQLCHAMAIAALFLGAMSGGSVQAASEPDGYPE